MAGYRYTAAAQSGGRGSNTTEILAGLDRSTAWLGAPRVASRAASASRMTRAQRSAKGMRGAASLHADQARRQRSEELEHLSSAQLPCVSMPFLPRQCREPG